MSNSTGFGFTEPQARFVSGRLERCLIQIYEAADFVQSDCSEATRKDFNSAIGKVITAIAMEILEDRIYGYFQGLRPRGPRREYPATEDGRSSGSLKTLDLSGASLLELLIEALYHGKTKFIPNLVAHEPLSIEEINIELERRSSTSRPGSVERWCAWYLSSNKLSSEEWQILSAIIENKKLLDQAFGEQTE